MHGEKRLFQYKMIERRAKKFILSSSSSLYLWGFKIYVLFISRYILYVHTQFMYEWKMERENHKEKIENLRTDNCLYHLPLALLSFPFIKARLS